MKRRLKILCIVCAVVAAVVVPAIIFVAIWASGSTQGTVHVGTANTPTTVAAAQPVAITTPYFSTQLPAGFTVRTKSETPQESLVQLRLVAATPGKTDQQAAFTVGTQPSDGLSGIADYHLRASNPTTYVSFSPPNLPTGAVAFHNTSGPAELVVFWPRNTRYAEIALSTGGGADLGQLQMVFAQLISNWQWQ